jgi:hypothetical protein
LSSVEQNIFNKFSWISLNVAFGCREIVNRFQSGKLAAYSSVVTIVEVLPKPVESGNEKLAEQFSEFN